MKLRITPRSKFVIHAVAIVLMIVALRTPATQSVILGALVEFAEITERVMQFPCWIADHSRCLSLDRFDPTCPQCM